jgi:hypothetical protein
MALSKVPSDAPIYGIMAAGEGAQMKEKHLMPSGAMYDKIASLLLPGAPIVVMTPNNTDRCRYIPESMHRAAYDPKQPYVFGGTTLHQIMVEAIRETSLCIEDCQLVAELRQSGIVHGVQYYLTGSANGRSGPSHALRPGLYRDLDIIAVSSKSRAVVESSFEQIAEKRYGSLVKLPKTVTVAGSGASVEGSIYTDSAATISIDFYAAQKLSQAFVRPEYLERCYYLQLS